MICAPSGSMTVYRITLERISTGERSPSLVTRQASEAAARAYAEDAIRGSTEPDDLRVVALEARMIVAAKGMPNGVRACPTSNQKLDHLQALRCSNRHMDVIALPAEPLRTPA